MAGVAQHVVSGLASGSIYALLALAIVIVYRSTGVINFAQGELATLAAFICWALTVHGWAYWPAFGVTVALAFGAGTALQRIVLRWAHGGPPLWPTVVSVGLLLAVNGLDTWIWGSAGKRFDGPFSASTVHVVGTSVSKRDLGMLAVVAVSFVVVGLLFTRTKLGLGLRASAAAPLESRFAGVRVAGMLAAASGLAAALGAVAGITAAPALHLEPNMMRAALLYAVAAAVLGGLNSPLGAVVGGLALGVLVELVGAYVHWVDGELRLALALAVLVAVLIVRPAGLMGQRA